MDTINNEYLDDIDEVTYIPVLRRKDIFVNLIMFENSFLRFDLINGRHEWQKNSPNSVFRMNGKKLSHSLASILMKCR